MLIRKNKQIINFIEHKNNFANFLSVMVDSNQLSLIAIVKIVKREKLSN